MDPIARPWQVVMFGVLAIGFWSWVGLWGWFHSATRCPPRPALIEAPQAVMGVPSLEIEAPTRTPHESDIREAIKAATPSLQAALSRSQGAGRLNIRVDVTAEGRVAKVSVTLVSGTVSDADQRALARALKQTPFPAYHETYLTEFPLIFQGPSAIDERGH